MSDDETEQAEQITREKDFFPTDCVLCPNTEETHEDHEQHMEDAHNV